MNASALIDTGAILALLDRDDEWHGACHQAFDATPLDALLRGKSEAWLNCRIGLWTMLSTGSIRLAEITHEELPEIHVLMTKYRDRPMDFADATLVHLAARESLSLILTIDHDNFETYRIGGRKRFTILPSRSAKQ